MKKRIISIDVNAGKAAGQIDALVADIDRQRPGYACFCNVHMLIEAYDDPAFANVVNSATYAFPDGFPVAKSFKWLHGMAQERIAGMDFLPRFLQVCNQHGYKVAIIGSTDEILEQTRAKIEAELPQVILTHLISPPFGKPWDNASYVQRLNESGTQVIFVALGCPKQEKWMHAHTGQVSGMMFGIGGALPTYVGAIRRAPQWMIGLGLEWLYRLYKEPRRMFRRYFYTNTKFLFLLARNMFKK